MKTIILIRHLIAVLKMPAKIGDKIIHAQLILSKLTNNLNFPVVAWLPGVVTLAQFAADVTALVNAQTAAGNKTGTVAARNAALAVVMADLRALRAMVQLKADANPANAENLIKSAGFEVRAISSRQKLQNEALNTEVLGTVLLTADGGGHHEWQMSKDMVTIINLRSTSKAHTTVNNLTAGDVWYFRNHKIDTAKVTYNWSPWYKLTIGAGGKTVGGGNTGSYTGNLPTT